MDVNVSPKPPRRRGILLAVGVAAVLALWFGRACFGGWWVADKTPLADTYMLGTLYERWALQLKAGHLPLWFPEFDGGYPVHAAWMYGLFYPPLALFTVLPPEAAWTWLAILHVAFGAAGMFAFLRGEDHDDASAATGAIVFAISGFMLGRIASGHLNLVMPLAWAPWVLRHTARCVRGERGAVAALGLCAGLGLIAGHVQVWFYVAPLAAAFAVLEMKTSRAWRSAMPRLALAVALAAGISAVQWLPALELVSVSGTVHEDASIVRQCSVPAQGVAAQVAPRFFDQAAEPLQHEFLGLAGPLAVGAVLLALFAPGRRRWFWLAVVGVGIVLATGTRNAVGAAANELPPFRFARAPGRAMVLVVLAAAPLAATFVAQWWKRAKWAAPLAFAASALLTLPAIDVVRSDFLDFDWTKALPPSAAEHRVNIATRRYPWLERFGLRTMHQVCPVETPGWAALNRRPNEFIAWWFDVGTEMVPGGRDRGSVPAWNGPPADTAATEDLARRTMVKMLPSAGAATFFAPATPPAASGDVLERMRRGERFVCVHGDGDDSTCRVYGEPESAMVRAVPTSSPSEMEFDVEAPSAGWLLVSSRWYPGWQFEVSGAWLPVSRANLAFLAVEVGPKERVRLRYAPAWLVPALAASALALVASVLLSLRPRYPSPR